MRAFGSLIPNPAWVVYEVSVQVEVTRLEVTAVGTGLTTGVTQLVVKVVQLARVRTIEESPAVVEAVTGKTRVLGPATKLAAGPHVSEEENPIKPAAGKNLPTIETVCSVGSVVATTALSPIKKVLEAPGIKEFAAQSGRIRRPSRRC